MSLCCSVFFPNFSVFFSLSECIEEHLNNCCIVEPGMYTYTQCVGGWRGVPCQGLQSKSHTHVLSLWKTSPPFPIACNLAKSTLELLCKAKVKSAPTWIFVWPKSEQIHHDSSMSTCTSTPSKSGRGLAQFKLLFGLADSAILEFCMWFESMKNLWLGEGGGGKNCMDMDTCTMYTPHVDNQIEQNSKGVGSECFGRVT